MSFSLSVNKFAHLTSQFSFRQMYNSRKYILPTSIYKFKLKLT